MEEAMWAKMSILVVFIISVYEWMTVSSLWFTYFWNYGKWMFGKMENAYDLDNEGKIYLYTLRIAI